MPPFEKQKNQSFSLGFSRRKLLICFFKRMALSREPFVPSTVGAKCFMLCSSKRFSAPLLKAGVEKISFKTPKIFYSANFH